MSKIEKLFTDDSNDHLDDEYHYNKSKSVTMEDMQKNHDEWWNSLTDKQKQQLFEEQEAAERERLEEEHTHTIWDEWGSDIGDEDMDEGLYKDKE